MPCMESLFSFQLLSGKLSSKQGRTKLGTGHDTIIYSLIIFLKHTKVKSRLQQSPIIMANEVNASVPWPPKH